MKRIKHTVLEIINLTPETFILRLDCKEETTVDKNTICYLCGNSEMIDQVAAILEKYGLPPENIRTEVFF